MDRAVAAILCRRYWIFDLDGTLTQPLHDFARIRAALGVPAERGILEHIAALPASQRRAADQQLTRFELDVAERARPNPGALELLQQLRAQGRQIGIFTRNRRQCVGVTLARLGVADWFAAPAIVACEDGRPKPEPDGIRQLLGHWGATPDQGVILGDYRYDLEAGRAAGIATLHLQCDRAERWPALTDLEIPDLETLARLQRQATAGDGTICRRG